MTITIDTFNKPSRYLFLTLLLMAMSPLHAQQTGETVRLQGNITEDTYAAGGTVDALANIEGDLVIAGGRVSVSDQISNDVLTAGGTVTLRANIGDDLRALGGDISLSGEIGDDAIMAGGNITINHDARIHGRAWLGGGRIDVSGVIDKELRAGGGQIIISGTVNGDVMLVGESISVLDGAVINGNLTYKSPQEAKIANGAQIRGKVSFEPVEKRAATATIVAAVAGFGIITLLSLFLTGGATYLIWPRFIRTSLTTIRTEPWKCLGLGLAVFAATPVVIGMLFMTVIGWLPALVIGALYLVLLLAGFLSAVFYIGDILFGIHKRDQTTNTRRLSSFAVALIIVLILGLIPLLGTLLLYTLMLLGVGALTLGMYRIHIGQPR